MARSTLVGGIVWALAVAGVGGVAASGAVEGFGPEDAGSSSTTTTAPAVVVDPATGAVVPAPPAAPEETTEAAPVTVDRTAEYLDAIVADSMEGLDEGIRPVVVCVSEAILGALGGAGALEQAGVSPQLFGVADDLTELGIPIDPGVRDAVAAAARDCGFGPVVAVEVTRGFAEALRQVGSAFVGRELDRVVDEADEVCIRERLGVDPAIADGFAAGYVLGDGEAADRAFAQAFGTALGACPHTLVPYFLEVARAVGLAPTPEGETCITGEVATRAQALASAFVTGDAAQAEALSVEVFEACEAQLGA